MKNRYTIGLDFGTSSCRALLAEVSTGKLLAEAECRYLHGVMDKQLPDGTKLEKDWVLQCPEDYIEALEKTVKEVMKKAHVQKEQVIGLGIDFTSCTILPTDKENVPLSMRAEYRSRPHAYVKLWKHHAAQREADFINERLGLELSSELLFPKVLQMVNEDYEIYHDADRILEAGDWLSQLLTGSDARSADMAAYKALWEKEKGYGLQKEMEKLHPMLGGFARTKLRGEVCYPGERIGFLLPSWAKRLGLSKETAVSAASIDAHAGVPGCGITKPGQMMFVVGTSTVQMVLEENPVMSMGVYGNVKDVVFPQYYAWESGIAAAGDMYEWFLKKCVSQEYKERAEVEEESLHKYLEKRAQILRPGQSGLLALEWWNGNKTPYVDSNRTGVLVGCTLTTQPEEIYRALLEATAYGTKQILETFEQAGTKVTEIFACGGIPKKNDLLMQICADVLEREIQMSAAGDIPALGAAMYAAVAAGEKVGGYRTIEEAVCGMREGQRRIFRPIPENAARYQELYGLYKELSKMFAPNEEDIMGRLKSMA